MSFAAALGIGNDPALKELRSLNRNFAKLYELNHTAHKEKEKTITRQDNILRRILRSEKQAYDDAPMISGSKDGMMKDIKEDENKMLALILGGGLLAGALVMGKSILDSLQGFFGQVEEKVLEEMDIDPDDSSTSAAAPSNVSASASSQETGRTSAPSGGNYGEKHLVSVLDSRGVTNKNERAMFLAQTAHESGNFRYKEEIWGPTAQQKHMKGDLILVTHNLAMDIGIVEGVTFNSQVDIITELLVKRLKI